MDKVVIQLIDDLGAVQNEKTELSLAAAITRRPDTYTKFPTERHVEMEKSTEHK